MPFRLGSLLDRGAQQGNGTGCEFMGEVGFVVNVADVAKIAATGGPTITATS